MSDVLPKIAGELPEEEQQKLRIFADSLRIITKKEGGNRWKRSTLSENNSLKMLPYIRELIKNRQPIEIPCFPGVKLDTMYLKWMGALQWFIESADVDQDIRNGAAMIRAITRPKKNHQNNTLMVGFTVPNASLYNAFGGTVAVPAPIPTTQESFQQLPDEVERRRSVVDRQASEIIAKARNDQGSVWKEELIEWVQSGESGVPFIKKGLMLTNDDIAFIQSFAVNADLISEVKPEEIRLMKKD